MPPYLLYPVIAVLIVTSVISAAAWRKARRGEREARELLRLTLHSISEGVILTDDYGRVTTMNPVAETLTGWKKTEAAGHPIDAVFKVVDADFRVAIDNPAGRAIREEAIVRLPNHAVLIGRDRSERDVEDSATPLRDARGQICGCLLVFQDVTERRQLERVVEGQLQAAKLLAAILEGANDAIVSTSLDGTITSWNPAAETLFGQTAQEAIGRHVSIVVPHQRLGELDEISQRIESGQRLEHFVTERLRSNFQKLQVTLTAAPLRNAAGHVIGAVRIFRDVTHQADVDRRERGLLAQIALLTAELTKRDRRLDH